jgi:hypothetical protein
MKILYIRKIHCRNVDISAFLDAIKSKTVKNVDLALFLIKRTSQNYTLQRCGFFILKKAKFTLFFDCWCIEVV